MKEEEYLDLKLRVHICPQQARWPVPNVKVGVAGDKLTISGLHWEKLHDAVNEARSLVREAWAELDAIDADQTLSSDEKRHKKARVATVRATELAKAKAFTAAKDMIAAQRRRRNPVDFPRRNPRFRSNDRYLGRHRYPSLPDADAASCPVQGPNFNVNVAGSASAGKAGIAARGVRVPAWPRRRCYFLWATRAVNRR
jgi:hypothetical protein